MRLLRTALLLTSLTCAPLLAQTPPAAPHGMTPDDLAKLTRVSAPIVSPDGAWIAYTVTSTDTEDDQSITHLWMISWDGTQDIQLTFGKQSAGSPRWSPDGRYLAFTSAREGGEAKGSQVWLLDRRGGEARQLTDVKQDLGGYRWSPDSKQLLLTLQQKDEPEPAKGAPAPKSPLPIVIDRYHFKEDREGYLTGHRPHLYLFDVATKKLTKLTANPENGPTAYAEEGPEWSPNGKLIAFVSNQSTPDPDRVDNNDIFVVPALPNSKPTDLTPFPGPDSAPLAWTPDSERIVFREALIPHYSIYNMARLMIVPAAGGPSVPLAPQLDQSIGAPTLTTNGREVLAEVPEDRIEYLAAFPISGHGEPHRLTPDHGPDQGAVLAHDESANHLAILWSTDAAPPELYALEGTRLRPLTHHNAALLATLKLAPTQDLSAKATDGNEVHGLLTLPLDYTPGTKAPLLLWIHGGPTSQDVHAFSPDRQLFATHGYAVLNVNYRGSTGRGHAYSAAIDADWGDKEILDLTAAVDAALATGHIDPAQLAVGGWSYGGILTDYSIASTQRYKAASSGAGMGNLLGFYGIDEYILQYEDELGPPWKNLSAYIKLSYPFLHADRITTPTLFMGGDKDFNVPLAGGEQMYQALRSNKIPAELIVYPGQFHGFTRPSFIKDRYLRWFAWYDHYARGLNVPATPALAQPSLKPPSPERP